MAALQEIQTILLGLHQNLEQGKSYLLENGKVCTQYINQIQTNIEGTIYREYSQAISTLQIAIATVAKAVNILNSVEGTLEKWSQERFGVSLGQQSNYPLYSERVTDIDNNVKNIDDSPKLLSQDEVNERWQSVLTTDEIIENYRDALVGMVIPSGKLLDKFLQIEKTKCLGMNRQFWIRQVDMVRSQMTIIISTA